MRYTSLGVDASLTVVVLVEFRRSYAYVSAETPDVRFVIPLLWFEKFRSDVACCYCSAVDDALLRPSLSI